MEPSSSSRGGDDHDQKNHSFRQHFGEQHYHEDDGDDNDDDDAETAEEELLRRRKQIIKTSWRAVQLGIDVKATEIFYSRLFEVYPQVRSMFPDDMKSQSHKLYATVSVAVDGIDDLENLVPVLQDLGVRHAQWGVIRAHYEAVTDCFLWTLNSYIFGLMPNNNAVHWAMDVADAWEWSLNIIGKTMADGADAAKEEVRRIRDEEEAIAYWTQGIEDEEEKGEEHETAEGNHDNTEEERG